MTNEEEKQLILSAGLGNESAFNQLYKIHYPQMLQLAKTLCQRSTTLTAADADDIASTAIFNVWQSLPNFQFRSKFSTYVYSITFNTFVSFARESNKIKSYKNAQFREHFVSSTLPDDEVLVRHFSKFIDETIKRKLSPKMRKIFELRYYCNFKYSDIAKTLDISLGNVKVSIHTARKRIKEEIIKKDWSVENEN